MVFFNYALRKLNAKIVYYGPGLCGKTTNLQWIHDHFEGGKRGNMLSLATEGDRTIFFDLLPLDIGTIRGMEVTLQLYTVPGQVHYDSTRQLVLRGADGVVFVADSQRAMSGSNLDSWHNLKENLLLQGIELASFPHVLQFNKRDLGDVASIERLDEELNEYAAPIFESVATGGIGVQETLEGIVKLVMRSLRERYETEFRRSPVGSFSAPTPPAAFPTTHSPPDRAGAAVTQPPVWPVGQAESPATQPSEPERGADSSPSSDYADDSGAETQPGVADSSVNEVGPADEEGEPMLVIEPEDKSLSVPKVGEVELDAAALETAGVEKPQDPWLIAQPLGNAAAGGVEPSTGINEGTEAAEPGAEPGEPSEETLSEETLDELPGPDRRDMKAAALDSEVDTLPPRAETRDEASAAPFVAPHAGLEEVEGVRQISEVDPGAEPFSLSGADTESEEEREISDDFLSAAPDEKTIEHQAAGLGGGEHEPGSEPLSNEVRPADGSKPVPVWEGDPFGLPDEPNEVEVHALAPVEARAVRGEEGNNQLRLRLEGTGALAEYGQVRELDIMVPVPGDWIGGQKVTLQFRLTLTPEGGERRE